MRIVVPAKQNPLAADTVPPFVKGGLVGFLFVSSPQFIGSPEMRMITVHCHSGWDAGIQPPEPALAKAGGRPALDSR